MSGKNSENTEKSEQELVAVTRKTGSKANTGQLVAIFGTRMTREEFDNFERSLTTRIDLTSITVFKDEKNDCVYVGRRLPHESVSGGARISTIEMERELQLLDTNLMQKHNLQFEPALFIEYISE